MNKYYLKNYAYVITLTMFEIHSRIQIVSEVSLHVAMDEMSKNPLPKKSDGEGCIPKRNSLVNY